MARNPTRHPLTIGFGLVALGAVALLAIIYKPYWRPLLWAMALSTLIYPAHQRLVGLLRGRVTLAAVISTVISVAVLVVPSALALNQLLSEARDLWPLLTARLGENVFARLAAWGEESPLGGALHVVLQVPRDQGAAGLEAHLRSSIEALGADVIAGMRGVTVGAPGALLQVGVAIVAFFFFLRQGPSWSVRLRESMPLEPEHAEALFDTTARTINAVFRGVLLTALAQATLATLGYVAVGAPVPALLGFVTFVTALLPFVGAAVVWLPTSIGLYLAGQTGSAIALAIWGTLVVSLVDNFLKPFLIGRDSQLPLLWLFLAILGGLRTFGVLGLLLGPGALALVIACARIVTQERARRSGYQVVSAR